MGKVFVIIITLVIAATAVFILNRRQTDNVHYHAGFVVYIDGKKQDYSGAQYMSIEPCSTGSQDTHREGEAHLHDGRGDVVHVHHTAVPWSTLFKSMGVTLGGTVTGYVNRKQVPDIMDRLIEPYDSAIIEVGKPFTPKLSDYVTKAHIQASESKSETCGK